MCGRYSLFGPVSVSREAKRVIDKMDLDVQSRIQGEDRFNIAPTQRCLVVLREREACAFGWQRWGLRPHWWKTSKQPQPINAKVETVTTNNLFRESFARRRCLVPISGYYEWTGPAGERQPWFLRHADGELLMSAGIWSSWRETPEDGWLHSFALVTGEAGRVSSDKHDREPKFLPPDRWMTWIAGTAEEAADALNDVPEADLVYFPVSRAVNTWKSEGPDLVKPIDL